MGRCLRVPVSVILTLLFIASTCFAATQTITDPWVDGETPTAAKWNSHENTFLSGINNVESSQIVDGAIVNADINTSAAIVASKLDLTPIAQDVTLDDGTTDSPTLTFQDATDETVTMAKTDAGNLKITTVAGDGVEIVTGNLKVGNGTPGTTLDGEDAYVEGGLEVDGAVKFDGAMTVAGTATFNGTAAFNGSVTGVAGVPTGAIILWDDVTCPSGYTRVSALDGKMLQANSTYSAAAGGADSVTLTESQIPSHTHTGPSHTHGITIEFDNAVSTGATVPGGGSTANDSVAETTDAAGTGATGATGGGTSFDNRPAYATILLCKKD